MVSVDLPERLQKWLKYGKGLTPSEDAPEEVKEELKEIEERYDDTFSPDLPETDQTEGEIDRSLRAKGITPVDDKYR